MDQTIKVSIIIPIYKVEPYIVRCIDSVLHQTYRELEVILVDDCTPDRSMELARERIESSPQSSNLNFVYLEHDHNRGLSAARNTGMDAANGEYVYFLDSDDEITECCIEELTSPLTKDCYDFVIGDVKIVGNDLNIGLKAGEGGICGNTRILAAYRESLIYIMACNKLYNLCFIRNNKLKFKEGLIHEDILWSLEFYSQAQKIYVRKKNTYIYYLRDGSITSNEAVVKKVRALWVIYQELRCFLSAKGLACCKHVNDMMEHYINYMHYYAAQIDNFSEYDFYQRIRQSDIRSFSEKMRLYSNEPKFLLLNAHYLLPVSQGWLYKKVLGSYFKVRQRTSVL